MVLFVAAPQGLHGYRGSTSGARFPTPLLEDIADGARWCQLPLLGSCSIGLPTPRRTTCTDPG